MKFSIGHRLFASVLLAMLAVAMTAIVLLRQNVMNSFADYAVNIELDRLDELSASLAQQYQAGRSWDFIAQGATARDKWIMRELVRLERGRTPGAPPAPPAPPIPPVPPAPPATPAPPAPAAAPLNPPETHLAQVLPPLAPPLAPRAPAAPQVVDAIPTPLVDGLSLSQRVTLLDAGKGYLAGRSIISQASVRRPIVIDGRTVAYLLVAKGSRPSDALSGAFLERVADSIPLILAACLLLSALAAVLLAAHFRKPILRLAAGARALADGDYGTRLQLARSDELGELAESFNQLAQRLDAAEASRRQWVADTSHELRTPLAVLRAQLEAIQDGVRSATPETTVSMLRQVLTLNKLIDELYTLARADVGALDIQRQRLDPWTLATEQAAAFGERFAAAGLSVTLAANARGATVQADPDRLRQVLANLFENCIRYCPPGAEVTLGSQGGPSAISLTIDDSGPGVPAEALARLGERFYRVEGSRSREHGGAGLGLALCRRIMEAHGGTLRFTRSSHGGLQARLTLPLNQT